ncbi:restriction endonuclease subunit S [Aromatoleum anaerobium]|uniref:Restriction endonuclease n=1 Tax=Aromatoleum anaerobium TaxID=182180 RepID=A0ABX1PFD2_9RHOO|nr:restriction endonuclease subunit S [Aromatoleum anaerobium]MCK0509259.1 restriction endonuclease subunit S [Aromatoleum anaerobium]
MSRSELLPAGWAISTLDDVAKSAGGSTPSKADHSYWLNGSIPWVSPKDMKVFALQTAEDTITEKALERLTVIPPESVLVVVRSGILSRTLPVALNSMAVTINQDMRAFIPEVDISARYLAWHLIANERDILAACSKHGTTVASIEGPALARFPLRIAPAAEQTRIVEKLEELLSDLDAAVAELKAAQKKLAQYRQSLLKAAVEGKLTAAWRVERAQRGDATETGAQLLARILTERRTRWEARQRAKFDEQGKAPPKGWQDKYPEPVAPDIQDLPDLPEGWVWATVDQLSPDDLANGRSVPSATVGAKVLRLTAVKDGCIDLNEYKTGDWSDEEAKPFAVVDGDLLIVRGNGSLSLVGRAGLVTNAAEQVAYPDTMIRLRVLNSIIRPEWVALLWDASFTRSHIERRARTSAGIYKISQPDILSVVIPVPPLEEQSQILFIFERAGKEMHSVAAMLDQALKQSAAQRQNILRAAFSGQLVPQDSDDEPASVLLERIRAERAEQAAVKKPRSRRARETA